MSFQNLLKKRIAAAPTPLISEANTAQAEIPTSSTTARNTPAAESREINALYSLLENRYTKEVRLFCHLSFYPTVTVADETSNQFPLSTNMMNPQSMPNHYTDLAKELDELPTRSRWSHFVKRISNMVRWQ